MHMPCTPAQANSRQTFRQQAWKQEGRQGSRKAASCGASLCVLCGSPIGWGRWHVEFALHPPAQPGRAGSSRPPWYLTGPAEWPATAQAATREHVASAGLACSSRPHQPRGSRSWYAQQAASCVRTSAAVDASTMKMRTSGFRICVRRDRLDCRQMMMHSASRFLQAAPTAEAQQLSNPNCSRARPVRG